MTDLLTGPDLGTTPTPRARLRENRGLVIIVVIVLLGAVVIALAQSRRSAGSFDPDGVDRAGSHALAQLLRDQGVDVVRVTRAQDAAAAIARHGGDATLLVVPTASVSSRMASAVAASDPAHLVLAAPDDQTVEGLAPWVVPVSVGGGTDELPASCTWAVAARVGTLPPDGVTYHSNREGTERCWGGLVIADTTDSTRTTTILGPAQALTNDSLATSGYAALAMNSLGASSTLVWWLPSTADPLQQSTDEPPSLQDLIPAWVPWAVAQVAVAMLFVVWWRGRRLGRVVVEPLPVVVRSTESVEGRARLYRRGRARGRAADALRAASLERMRVRLALPPTTDVVTVATAVAARTGRTPDEVVRLLAPGSAPADDAALTLLADRLDHLENEVRRS